MSEGARVLYAKTSIHAGDTRIVHPRHAELHEAIRFHQLLGGEGISGIALE
jgi:hypothetical protein